MEFPKGSRNMFLNDIASDRCCTSSLVAFFLVCIAMIGCKPSAKESKVEKGINTAEKIAVVDSPPDHVLVIENTNSPTSIQIAKYYMEKRGVKKVLQVSCPDSSLDAASETLEFAVFQESIEKPLREYLSKDTKIDYIVLNKGIPIRLSGAPIGFANSRPSLDSYLAALDYFDKSDTLKVVIDEGGYTGKCFVNRFWNSSERFSHAKHGGYLVTRLDGFTAASALALVDSSIAGEKTKPTGTIDRTETFVGSKQGLMGYASWGSNDAKFATENYQSIRFAPGAIAETAVSTSGRTFLPSAGGQSLIAELIEARVTGAKGYCDEPFLPAIASPTILFDRYSRGWNLAESFYAASRFVGWEDIVIGDPLSAPYAKR